MNPSITTRVLEMAVQIQQVPAPTFMETQRAAFIENNFQSMGIETVRVDEFGNVYGRIKGRGDKPAIVVSAHLDTVFHRSTKLTIDRTADKISGPGIGDNSIGLAGLFGLYWALNEEQSSIPLAPRLERDIWLVANVGEEGLGDLRGMKAVVDHFGKDALAYVVLEGMSLGHVYHRGLGVRRYRINVHTSGGHSWIDYGKPSAIHVLADLVANISKIKLPIKPRSSINVGMISGGTSVNTIASHACCELDLRSENSQPLNTLTQQVEALVAKTDQTVGEAVRVSCEVIGIRPYGDIPVDHPLVKLARKCYTQKGIETHLSIGSTDANEPLSRGLPAICVGLTTGGGAHTVGEYIHTQPLHHGLDALVHLIQSIDQLGNASV